MQIDIEILMAHGAFLKQYKKEELIFEEDRTPQCFFQVLEGMVKVVSTNSDGKDLIQKTFGAGESFGEPPLVIGKPYPCSAIAVIDSTIIKLGRDAFFSLLEEQPAITKDLLVLFAQRIYDKTAKIQIMNSPKPEDKILGFLNKFKEETKSAAVQQVPYTRQQIADFVGLRVETVIKTLCMLDKMEKVKILNHKVYY